MQVSSSLKSLLTQAGYPDIAKCSNIFEARKAFAKIMLSETTQSQSKSKCAVALGLGKMNRQQLKEMTS